MFVGLLFYIPARAHRHKGRKLRFQEAQRRRHTRSSGEASVLRKLGATADLNFHDQLHASCSHMLYEPFRWKTELKVSRRLAVWMS